ncbi:MAG: hypothetical protein RIE86_09360 [Imperialibacter sp.]|uniref:hypothetical protein n=1 Tax=Imperialibacter sp. TaxID=2038411 RepID=UPI0032ED6492
MKKLFFILLFLVPALSQAQNPNYSKPGKRSKAAPPAPTCYTLDEVKIGAHVAAFKAWQASQGIKGRFYKSTDPSYQQYFTYLDRNDYPRADGTIGSSTFTKTYYFQGDTCIAMSIVPNTGFPLELATAEMQTRLGSFSSQQDSTFQDHGQVLYSRFTWALANTPYTAILDTWNRPTSQGTRYDEYTIVFLRQQDTPKQSPYISKSGI